MGLFCRIDDLCLALCLACCEHRVYGRTDTYYVEIDPCTV